MASTTLTVDERRNEVPRAPREAQRAPSNATARPGAAGSWARGLAVRSVVSPLDPREPACEDAAVAPPAAGKVVAVVTARGNLVAASGAEYPCEGTVLHDAVRTP